jgi:hypothetical protein
MHYMQVQNNQITRSSSTIITGKEPLRFATQMASREEHVLPSPGRLEWDARGCRTYQNQYQIYSQACRRCRCIQLHPKPSLANDIKW